MRERRPVAAPRRHIFGTEGEAALDALFPLRPLLAFDFDGTLAPIVARPGDARLSQAVASRLAVLAERAPVAVVSGRSLADLRQRLGFDPTYLVGNHGAEDSADPGLTQRLALALAPLRERLGLRQHLLVAAGVSVEDKGPSIALHYRLAPDRRQSLAVIQQVLSDDPLPALKVFGGKCVVNVAPEGSPDKAAAVQALVQRSGAGTALFAGDDLNDEPVFATAPAHWLTLRVGRDDAASQARFFLDSPAEMALLLERLLTRIL